MPQGSSDGLSSELINSAIQELSIYFKRPICFSKIVPLSEPERRNLILRLEIENPAASIPKSFILKQPQIESDETDSKQFSRFAHDWAGLEFLTMIGGDHAPQFYLGNVEHKFIIIEDLGEPHHSLVGPLTRASTPENSKIAETVLAHYVRRLGKLHADTAGKRDIYSSILKKIYSEASRYHFFPDNDIHELLEQIKKLTGIASSELEKEIISISDFAKMPNEFNTLLHGDICPDNVYVRNDDIKIIDFEFADFGNALLDGTYLRMCMPTCWCAKAVPASILQKMEMIYRDELKKKIPAANNDQEFKKQLIYACAYWVLRSIQTIFSANLLEQDSIGPTGPLESDSVWRPEKNTSRPRALSKLQAFITCMEETNHLPELKNIAEQLLKQLQKSWPDTNHIDVYPVFESIAQ